MNNKIRNVHRFPEIIFFFFGNVYKTVTSSCSIFRRET